MKVKEKLYHFIEKVDDNIGKAILLALISLIVCISIFSTISYIVLTISMYEYELNMYPEDTYKKLNEIADNLVIEGVGINLKVLSKIDNYDIKKENGNIVITYSVTNKTTSFFSPSEINMNLKLSSDFHIISKKSNCSSKEVYSEYIKSAMIEQSICIGSLVTIVLIFLFYYFFGKIYEEYTKKYNEVCSNIINRLKPL